MLDRSGSTNCALSPLMSWDITAFATVAGSRVGSFRLKALINFSIRGVRTWAGCTILRECVSEMSKECETG